MRINPVIPPRIMLLLLAAAFFQYILINAAYCAEIILDPGHYPARPGAVSHTGEKELVYNESLVNSIKSEFERKRIGYKITRQPGQNMALMPRTKGTKDAGLFLSIHHDSVQPQFIQYVDGKPVSEKGEGYSLFVSRKNKYFNESVAYARKIAQNLYNAGLRPSRHHGEKIKGENREALDEKLGIYVFDDLVVLKHSQCPAVLFEAGVLVHPRDEKLVKSAKFKSVVSRAIADAVK